MLFSFLASVSCFDLSVHVCACVCMCVHTCVCVSVSVCMQRTVMLIRRLLLTLQTDSAFSAVMYGVLTPISDTHMHSTSQTHNTHSSEKSSKTEILLPKAQNNSLPTRVRTLDNIFQRKCLNWIMFRRHPGAYHIIQLSGVSEDGCLNTD